jgi:DNA-binding CsgD family transcriptional regulator
MDKQSDESKIKKLLYKSKPIDWSYDDAKAFQTWSQQDNHTGKRCAEILKISYESAKQSLRRHGLSLRQSNKRSTKWSKEMLEEIIAYKIKTKKSFKDVAEDLGYSYKTMYGALARNKIIPDDLKRNLSRNKKHEEISPQYSIINVPWDPKNKRFKEALKSHVSF